MQDAGGELYVWTVDDPRRIRRFEQLGVDGVITNDPRLFAPTTGLITQRPSEVPGGSPAGTFRIPWRVFARAASTTTSRVARPLPALRLSRHWNSTTPRTTKSVPGWGGANWKVQPLWRARYLAVPR